MQTSPQGLCRLSAQIRTLVRLSQDEAKLQRLKDPPYQDSLPCFQTLGALGIENWERTYDLRSRASFARLVQEPVNVHKRCGELNQRILYPVVQAERILQQSQMKVGA